MQIVELKVNVEKSQLEALAAEVEKLNGKVINFKTSTGGTGGASPTAGMAKGFKETQQQAEKTGQSIMSVVGKVAKWTAVTTAVYAPVKAFKEAVSTIKALDTEMVNVQKVTGASSKQMQQFQQQAYQLSTQYGRSVTDVAAAMTSFARAGYGDKLGEMAELSTLIQNVGYVSEDTADSMLLAVDAAWKLGGSHEKLMKVIDGVDKITNQNATDFQKMAEGMTVAASVFAESGESIETFAAMVGTGTAATQRGGSEIARGLRTIMMNIRQIKGETEDGELIDGESIAKASLALKEFAGISTMENGELRKASDVLTDLAHKWNELDEVQQSAIGEALAGKRQANILMALMGSWDMYEKQIQEYANATGTAFKENEIYMDSWAAKTEQLKSKWTDFVANFVTSDLATGFLDGLIKGVEVLDSGFGQAAIKAGAFALAMNGITKGLTALAGTAVIRDLGAFISLLSTEGIAAFGALSATITPLMAISALSADFMFMAKAVDDAYVSLEEQADIVTDLKTQYEQLTGAGSEYAQLMDKVGTGTLTEQERARLTVLNAQADALERQIKLEEERQFQMFQQQESGTFQLEHGQMVDTGVGKTGDVKRLQEMNKLYEEGYDKVKKGESSLEDYRGVLQDIIADNSDWYEQMKEWEDLGFGDSFTDAQREAMALYETIAQLLNLGDEDLPIVKTLDEFEESGRGVTEFANQTVVDAAQMRQAFAEAGLGVEEANAAIEALRAGGAVVIDVENDGAKETLNTLEELGIAVKDGENWKVNVDGLTDLLTDLGMSKDEANELAKALAGVKGAELVDANGNAVTLLDTMSKLGMLPPLELLATANTSDAEGKMGAVEEKKESLEQPTNTELNATDNASGTIANASAQATRFGDMRPRPTISVNDRASGVLSGIVGLISSIKSKAVTITTTHVERKLSYTGTSSMDLHGHAAGALNFKGGPTLLGDELSPDGSPRPELVITKNGAFIAGMAGPVMTSLPAGSRIFKYSDTVDILSGGDLTQVQAFAKGGGGGSLSDIYLRGKNGGSKPAPTPKPTPKPSGGSGSGSGGKGGKGSGSGSGGRSSGSSGSSGGGGSSVDTLKEELELLEAQYSFLEASNASTEELWAKSDEIKAKLHQINDTLRSTGGKEKDIVDYSTKWWQEVEKQRGLLEDDLSLLEAQYSFLEESGASAEDLNAKSAEIQDKLHEINELARATGASQEDILETSTKWWAELKKIREVQRQVYQNERDLFQSEADLMEHQNKSAGERISKLREIQDNLHREAEYMRSIKADQAEINQLSIQWWEIQQNVLAIQQDLVDQLNATMTAAIENAEEKADDSVRNHTREIKRLEKEKEARLKELREKKYAELELDRDDLELKRAQADQDQRRLDLKKARIALENAQKDRSVRYYNAATGQWEWGADARKVQQAQEAYDKAKTSVEEGKTDVKKAKYELDAKKIEDEYKLRIQAENDIIDSLMDQLDGYKEEWDDLFKKIFGPDTEDVDYLLNQMLEQGIITKDQAKEIKDFWNRLNGFAESIDNTTKGIFEKVKLLQYPNGDLLLQTEEGEIAIPSEYANSLNKDNTHLTYSTEYPDGSKNNYTVKFVDGKPVVETSTTTTTKTPSGGTTTKKTYGTTYAAEVSNGSNSSATSASSSSGSYKGSSGSSSSSSSRSKISSSTAKKNTSKKFDSGGILSGLGGIKATPSDEIVIPPDLADYMLRPSVNNTFKSRVSELAYLYGAKPIPGTLSNNRSSNDHYGDTYTFGNVTLTEDKARNTTVYELAQMSRSLGIYRNG